MHSLLAENRDVLISNLLLKHQFDFHPVLDLDLNSGQVARLDFTAANPLLVPQDLLDTTIFDKMVNHMLREKNALYGIGGYLENRVIYRRSYLFDNISESRSIHLGIDIWAPSGVAVFAPLPGTVYGFYDNEGFGDYGPTIILEHELEGELFYTLYGHLARTSLLPLTEGMPVEKGRKIAEIGPFPENGDWPPHLHFQVMTEMQGFRSDFPGVCKPSDKEAYRHICIDPNLILKCRHLLA